MVKNFYSNFVDTSSKRFKVIMCGTNVQYSEATINMMLELKNVGDTYQHLLETIEDENLDILKVSPYNPSTK